MDDNNKLITNIQRGDQKSFKLLFTRFSKSLYYYAITFVDEDSAKDIVQDVFYEIWSNSRIKIKSSITSYLFKMTRNYCLLKIEKESVRKKYSEHKQNEQLKDELIYYTHNPLNNLIEAELTVKYENCLKNLPPKCSEIFKLSRIEGNSNKVIANKLEISVKTVEMHISRALKDLRKIL
jgi:RNA polymerase sigma-70 factor (ECF subfamily)